MCFDTCINQVENYPILPMCFSICINVIENPTISVKTKHRVRRVMAILRHGCFFFFLSKLLAVKCSSTNPTGSANFGGQNEMSQWSGPQPVTNGYNSFNYNPPQGFQSNGVYPKYGQQFTMPRSPQSNDFQQQQYSPTIQSNPVMQNQFGQPQPQYGQSNLNSDYQYQPTNTQYPNYNNVNIDHNQPPNYQENQSALQSQGVNLHPQLYQFQPQALPTSSPQQSTSQLKPTMQNPLQSQQPTSNSPFPQQFKTPKTPLESSKPSQITSQFPSEYISSDQSQLPMSSPQQSTSQLKPTMQNPLQSQQPTSNSPFPQQFKTQETPLESSKPSQFPSEYISSDQSQLPMSSPQQSTSQLKPTMQNPLQSQQPTSNSPFPQQFKTPETPLESSKPSQFPSEYISSDQSQLPMSSPQQSTSQLKPTMQNPLQSQQPTSNSPFPQQFKTPETPLESSKPSQFPSEYISSDQSQLPMSSPQQSTSQLKPTMQNPLQSQQPTSNSPFPQQFKTPETSLESSKPSQITSQFPSEDISSDESQLLSFFAQPFTSQSKPTIQNPIQPQQSTNSPFPQQFKTPETPLESSKPSQFPSEYISSDQSQLPMSSPQQSTSQLKPTMQNPLQSQQPTSNSPFPQQFKTPETSLESSKPSQITSQFPSEDISSDESQLLSFFAQPFTSQSKPTIQNPIQPQQSTNSPFPQQFKTPETPLESSKPSQITSQFPSEDISSDQSQLPTSSPQQSTSQLKPTMQNPLQSQQPTSNSPFPQQFKTPETPLESSKPSQITSQFPSEDISSDESQLLSFFAQPFTSQSKPTIQNPIQPQQSTNSPFPQQFKTPETQSESNKPSQYPTQDNSSSNQSQSSSLSMSSSPQQPTLKSKPNTQSYPSLQQLTNLSFQSQLENAEVQSTKTPSQTKPQPSQSNSFPYQSQSQSIPISPPLQPFPLHSIPTMQNAPQSPQPTKSSPSPQLKTPETQSAVNKPSQIKPQSSLNQIQSQTFPTSSSLHQYTAQPKPFTQNPPQVPQPTKLSPLQNSNVPDELPGSENISQNEPNSPMTFNTFKYIPNHLEPFQTLPPESTISLNNNVMQDQDFQILDFQLNKPNELSFENEITISSPDNSDNDTNSNDNLPITLKNDQSTGPEDEESNLESKMENASLQRPTDLFDDTSVFKENIPLISPNNLIFNDPSTSTGLSMYDTPNPVDIEDPKNAEEINVKYRVYADPNDIHIINVDPVKSSSSFSDKSDLNNINLINSQPTRTSWSPPFPWSNNVEDQKSSFNSDQLLSSLNNNNRNPMFYNQMSTDTSSNNYDNQFNSYLSANQKNTPSDVSTNANQPSSTDDNGYIYKQIDFKNPPSSISSWSLTKNDYSKNQWSDQKNGIPLTNKLGTPTRYNQNDNQYISNPFSNYNKSIQNMITVIANAVQAPLDGTSKIFDITRASFPNTEVIQQLNLTYSVVKSIILSLRKILNTVVNNLFGRRVKRDFNMLGPMSSLSPKTVTEPVQLQFPTIGNLKKKDYQQSNSADSFQSNTNAYYDYRSTMTAPPPTVNMKSYYNNQPLATASTNMNAQIGKFENQLYSRRRQQTYGDDQIDDMDDMDIDEERPSQRSALNVRVARQSPNTQKYAIDVLGNEIQTAIFLNLPDSYSSDSPEVQEYTQKIIWAVEMIFRSQINNVIQGNSPNINTF